MAVPARTQEPSPGAPALRVTVELVTVEVAVTDAAGKFIPDIKAENFRVSEDGVPQAVRHFEPTRAPVRIALLVESSPAVFLIQAEHLTAAHTLLRSLRAEDEAALYSYARSLRWETDFSRDKQLVEDRLDALGRFGLEMAETNLTGAVSALLDRLQPTPRRTAVLVIATGLDSGSPVAWETLRQRLGASQVTFFAVATGRLLRSEPGGKKHKPEDAEAPDVEATFRAADARLRALAEASAGEAYFPKSPQELDGIYRDIGERLRNLYSLGYYPANKSRDGAYRSIRVELVDQAGAPLVLRDRRGRPIACRVFARPGYFAPRE